MLSRSLRLRLLIVVSSLMAPVLGGALIYCSLRKTHPGIAHFANGVSFISFFAAAAFLPSPWAQGDGRLLMAAAVGLGVTGAALGVRLIRAAGPGVRRP